MATRGDGAGVAADHHRALVHVVGQAPADVVVDLEARPIGEAGAEVARRAAHANGDRVDQPDADVVAGVGVEDLDIGSASAPAARIFSLASRTGDRGEVYRDHVSAGAGRRLARVQRLAREQTVEGNLLGGDRDQVVGLVENHWLRRQPVLGVADLVLGRDEERERAVHVVDRGLEHRFEGNPRGQLVGEVDRDQLGIVVGAELETARL